MKILFVGNTRRTALALNYFTNLVRLGYLVLPYDPEYFYARHLLEKVAIRLTKAPPQKKIRQVSETLVGLCKRNRFDVILVMAENFLGHETIREMRSVSPKPPLFVYHSHDNNFSPGILKPADFSKTLQAYDFVFTTKSQNVPRYKSLGQVQSYFIPSAYEPSIHHPIADEYSLYGKRWFDVTFIGTYDKSREPFLEKLGWDSLYVWGDGWKRSRAYSKHKQQIQAKAIYDFQFADVTSHSRCALGLLREEAGDLHTTRTFEIPACGALQLAPRNSEILSFFEEDKEIVCFANAEELKEKVAYYLSHNSERLKIARAGFDRCLKDKHTYLDRVSEMFRTIRNRSYSQRPRTQTTQRPLTNSL
jgi:spore maturation protein CgeB